jgi:hypothetical protein
MTADQRVGAEVTIIMSDLVELGVQFRIGFHQLLAPQMYLIVSRLRLVNDS